jgi:hypothetical protein
MDERRIGAEERGMDIEVGEEEGGLETKEDLAAKSESLAVKGEVLAAKGKVLAVTKSQLRVANGARKL